MGFEYAVLTLYGRMYYVVEVTVTFLRSSTAQLTLCGNSNRSISILFLIQYGTATVPLPYYGTVPVLWYEYRYRSTVSGTYYRTLCLYYVRYYAVVVRTA